MRKNILLPAFQVYFQMSVFLVFCLTFQAVSIPPAFSKEKPRITREEFINLMAKHQPANPLFPQNAATLSPEKLYDQTVKLLKLRNFSILEGKDPKGALKDIEFVTVTYAFSGAPAGKGLLDQKLYLKNAGIVVSPDIGLATAVEGQVFQSSAGESLKRQTHLASPVFLMDKIDTKVNSKVSFSFDDASSISIGENAEVKITKHIFDPNKNLRQTVVEVSLGAVRFAVTKEKNKDSTFKVITPAGIAGVRGTEFVIIVEPDGKTTFVGLEGSIETIPFTPEGQPGKAQIISQEQTQEISKSGQASSVSKAPLELLQQAKQKTALEPTVLKDRGVTRMKAEMAAKISKRERLANEAQKETDATSLDGDEKSPNPGDATNIPQSPLKEQGRPGKPVPQNKPVS
jgi:hypothetical protein